MEEEVIPEMVRAKLIEAVDNTSDSREFGSREILVLEEYCAEAENISESKKKDFRYWKYMFEWYNARQEALGRMPKSMYCVPCYRAVREYVKRMVGVL